MHGKKDCEKHATWSLDCVLKPSRAEMQVIDERISFSQPQLLKVTPWAQVIRFKYKASRNAPNISAQDCVLKIFGEDSRILFDKEVAAYARLVQSKTSATYAKPLGYSKWTAQKYERTIGRNITRMGDGKAEVYVLMLEFVVGRELTAKDFTKPLAISCLKSLDQLHALAIVHGDINPSNLLLLEDDSTTDFVWLDFSFSWTDASPAQLDWETDRAVEYLSDWVSLSDENMLMTRVEFQNRTYLKMYLSPRLSSNLPGQTNPSNNDSGPSAAGRGYTVQRCHIRYRRHPCDNISRDSR